MTERPEFLVDDEFLPAAAAGFQLAGVVIVEAIARVPGTDELLRLVRAEAIGLASKMPPPDMATGILRERWSEIALSAIRHVFDHAELGPEN